MLLWDKITGKMDYQLKLQFLQIENEKLLKAITERQESLEKIKNFSNSNDQLLAETDRLNDEIAKKNKEIIKYENLFNKYKNELNVLEKYIKKIDLEHKEIIEKSEVNLKNLKNYKNIFGNISLPEEETEISDRVYNDEEFFKDMIIQNEGNEFNDKQKKAIRYNEGHLRIIAGAGSGKTQTICAKAVYLNQMERVNYNRICMITFTKKAAEEMASRIKKFASNDWRTKSIVAGTFNGVFNRIVQRELIPNVLDIEEINKLNIILTKRNNKNDEEDEENNDNQKMDVNGVKYGRILNELISEYSLEEFEKYEKVEKNIKDRIEYWLSLDFSFENICESIKNYYDEKYIIKFGEEYTEIPVSERFAKLLHEFQEKRKKENVMVYNDQIQNIKKALSIKKVQEYLQKRFDYIFIDEFQDTNQLQINILKLLSPPEKKDCAKIVIVGDPNQSIYAFRGCDSKYIQEFDTVYIDMKTVYLMRNYRSKKDIVQKANRLIKYNKENNVPSMDWFHDGDNTVIIEKPSCDGDEAKFVIEKSRELGNPIFKYIDKETNEEIEDKDNPNFTNCAVLYRAKYQVSRLIKELTNENIPFIIEEEIDLSVFEGEFKYFYFYWLRLSNEPGRVDKAKHLKKILNIYYVKNEMIINIMNKENCNLNTDSVLTLFINKYEHYKDYKNHKRNLITYLNLLNNLEFKKDVRVSELMNCLIDFPAHKKSESYWQGVKKELEGFETFQQIEEWRKKSEMLNRNKEKNIKKYNDKRFNALYLLTIHKSKGLDFKNVFIVGCYEGGIPSNKAVYATEEEIKKAKNIAVPLSTIEEERRLMYVAMTRARNYAFILFPTHIDNQAKKSSIFISEIRN